jgi:hypothetical protein
MENNGSPVQWGQLRTHALRQRSRALLGPSTATNAEPTLSFTARYTPTGQLRVIVDQACNLADVHDLSVRIACACLDDDPDVAFSREPVPEVLTTTPTNEQIILP